MIKINYILITIYFLIYNLYHFFPKYKKLSILIFTITICIECIITVNHNWNIDHNINEFYSTYNDITNSINNIKNKDNELFYRTEKNNILTFNDGSWYDYYGQTTFSSMAYNSISELNNNLGQPGNYINSYYYKQNTPIYDLIFNIKYTIGNNNDFYRYNLILNENDTLTYKFKYTTGLMYGVNKNINKWNYNYNNPFEYQNEFIKYSTNIENTLYKLNYTKKEIIEQNENETIVKLTYNNPNENIYLYDTNYLVNYIIIDNTLYYKDYENIYNISDKINTNIYNYETYNEAYIINKNILEDEIEIYISYKEYYDEETNLYSIDNEKFIKAYNILNNNKVKITKFKENYIKGTINSNISQTIFTSIPYDKGWNIFINNKKVNTYKISNSLLAFDIDKGQNTIELKYLPNNIDIGISISITTLIFSTTYIIIKRKTNHQSD